MLYPKINSLFKRDMANKGVIIEGDYSCPEFENVKRWGFTEKIDGTNIRVICDYMPDMVVAGDNRNPNPISIQFRGRTDSAQFYPKLLVNLQDEFIPKIFEEVFDFKEMTVDKNHAKIILFGEGYGANIQKGGGDYSDDVGFILFDVWIDGWWLKREAVIDIANKIGIAFVPDIDEAHTINEAIEYIKSKPKSRVAIKDKIIEGVVARSDPLVLFRNGNPLMWKLKVKDYEHLERVNANG